jgi:hypothetical protein
MEIMNFAGVGVDAWVARKNFSHGKSVNMKDDFFLSARRLINSFFLICFCCDGNQSKQVVVSVPMLQLR